MNMPATFMWARGFDDRPERFIFAPPQGANWKVATQLYPTNDPWTFTAPNLQYMMDSPTELSAYAERQFAVKNPDGRTFTIRMAVHSQASDEDLDFYAAGVQKIVREAGAVYGEYPEYEPGGTYTFLADYLPWDGGDGMEHRNSTVVTGRGSVRTALGTASHEFFHCWNVERIRPQGLEPFNFEDANMTDSLWIAEGFTQYYGSLLLARAGIWTPKQAISTFGLLADAVVTEPGRQFNSAVGMSHMAPFVDAARSIDPPNFSNTFISYYTYGGAIALGLDLSLRDRTGGKISLDDFMRAMWRKYGKPRGPEPGLVGHPYWLADVHETLAEVAGDRAFADDFFNHYMVGRDAVDYAPLMQRAGIVFRKRNPGRAWIGDVRGGADGGTRIASLTAPGSPAYEAGLDQDDQIVAIDGKRVETWPQVQAALASHAPRERLRVEYRRRTGAVANAAMTLTEDPSLEAVLVEDTGGTPTPRRKRSAMPGWDRTPAECRQPSRNWTGHSALKNGTSAQLDLTRRPSRPELDLRGRTDAIHSRLPEQFLSSRCPMLSIEREFIRTERPLYGHLVSLLEGAISRGELPSGARVPPERTLAQRLKISRTTVVSAYRELEARGLLRGYVGRGTFVCAAPEPEGTPFAWRGKIAAAALRSSDSTLRDVVRNSSDSRLLSLAAGEPAIDKFPSDAYLDATKHVLASDPGAAWGHGPTEGQPALRNAIADRYSVPRESVLILSGAQQGLDLLARCLIDPGDAVIMDRPGYLGAIQSFRAAGAKLIGWDIVRGDSDELEDLLVRYRPKLIYTNPTFHNPTGVTMPIRTRREVLSLAQRYRVPIVEDATYRDLYFNEPPPPSLREMDDCNLVIYLNSFSKVMAPGLRLGWISAAPSIVDQIAIIKQRIDPHTPNLVQFAVARLMRQGAFDAHLRTIRGEHARRCTQVIAAMQRHVPPGAIRAGRPAGGLYLWCRLGPGLSATTLHDRALAAGVTFVPGPAFYPDPAGDSELRLCFTSILPSSVDEAIKRLGRCVGEVRLTA